MAGKDEMSTAPGPTGSFTPPSARAQAHRIGLNAGLIAIASGLLRPVKDAEPATAAPKAKAEPEAEQGAQIPRPGPGAQMREIRSRNGCGRPPRTKLAKATGTASERTDSAGEKRSSTP